MVSFYCLPVNFFSLVDSLGLAPAGTDEEDEANDEDIEGVEDVTVEDEGGVLRSSWEGGVVVEDSSPSASVTSGKWTVDTVDTGGVSWPPGPGSTVSPVSPPTLFSLASLEAIKECLDGLRTLFSDVVDLTSSQS